MLLPTQQHCDPASCSPSTSAPCSRCQTKHRTINQTSKASTASTRFPKTPHQAQQTRRFVFLSVLWFRLLDFFFVSCFFSVQLFCNVCSLTFSKFLCLYCSSHYKYSLSLSFLSFFGSNSCSPCLCVQAETPTQKVVAILFDRL